MTSSGRIVYPPKPHYHIRWSTGWLLDWQAFGTREQAEAAAAELVRPNESYAIEEITGNCEPCKNIVARSLTTAKSHAAGGNSSDLR